MADYLPYKDISCKRGIGKLQRGYYRRTRNGVTYPQHRLAYIDEYGQIDNTFVTHHTCEDKWCVTPQHLIALIRSEHQFLHASIKAREFYVKLTTCKRGHPLDGRNKKQRFCLTCKHMAQRSYLERKEQKYAAV